MAQRPVRTGLTAAPTTTGSPPQRLELDHQFVEDVAALTRTGSSWSDSVEARPPEPRMDGRNFAIDVDDGRTRLFVITERLFERNEVLYSSFEEEER
jgi:hypothetical protein